MGAGQGPVGVQGAKPPEALRISSFLHSENQLFLVSNCMCFEQLKCSPSQSAALNNDHAPEKHNLISHSKQEEKKPLRSYQFSRSLGDICFCCLPNSHVQKSLKSFDTSLVNKHKLKKNVSGCCQIVAF